MTEATTKGQLVLARNFVEVLVHRGNHLAHAVIPLGTAIRHDQVRSNFRKAALTKIIGKSQLLFIIPQGNLVSLNIHSLPLLAHNCLRKECWGKHVRESQGSADRLNGDCLIPGRSGGQTTTGDVGR